MINLRARLGRMTSTMLSSSVATLSDEQKAEEDEVALVSQQLTHVLEKTKALFVGHGSGSSEITISSSTQATVELYRRLRRLVRIDLLADASVRARALENLAEPAMGIVLASLLGALTSASPGAEPRNREAQRQLMFFCNSLHNRALTKPPPVTEMRSVTSFTPHYSEEAKPRSESRHSERTQ